MIYDLAVIGAGFWGATTARFASVLGCTVLLMDCEHLPGASRAASGYYNPKWYKGPWRARAQEGFAAFNGSTKIGAVLNGKANMDWVHFDREDLLKCRVRKWNERCTQIVPTANGFMLNHVEAKQVVIAAGVWTDQLLKASGYPALGLRGMGGAGLYFSIPTKIAQRMALTDETPLMLIPVNPYKSYVLRYQMQLSDNAGTAFRVCATQENPLGDQQKRLKMQEAAFNYLARKRVPWSVQPLYWEFGVRPILDEPTVKLIAPGLVAASGGARIGGMLSFWAAQESLKLLRIL